MQRAKKQLTLKKYSYHTLILNSILLLNFNTLSSMEENTAYIKKRSLSTKFQPSEKFLTSNPDCIDYFASLYSELIALITTFLCENPLCSGKRFTKNKELLAVLQNITSFALLNKAMLTFFSESQSDFAKHVTTCLIGNIADIDVLLSRKIQIFPTTKINDREKLIVPFLKRALNGLIKQNKVNNKWRNSLKYYTQKALEKLTNYQELTYVPRVYTIRGLNGFAVEGVSTIFTIFCSGVGQKKIHYHSTIAVEKFYNWHVERRSHYCTLLSFALDMINFSELQNKPFDFIKLLIAQGANPCQVCTQPSCQFPTALQEAETIAAQHPEILALLNDTAPKFLPEKCINY